MNRKLLEHLFGNKFHLEARVRELDAINVFQDQNGSRLHDVELEGTKARLRFVNQTLDIVFSEPTQKGAGND